ncbi:hypothetical protein FS837_008332 [Tulasnella sp. UAMH 9824]|nr:hypothetical protein FS837_008332 [Tulasnella sp. UAMH 9824]
MEKRRIKAQRAQSAQSTRGPGSIDSFLIEHFTSSESSEDGDTPPVSPTHLDQEPAPLTAERCDLPLSLFSTGQSESSVDETRTWTSNLRSRVQHALTKRRAKILFTKLISSASDSKSEAASKKRRREAADNLLEIAKRGPDGKDIVARRLVKTARREEQAIRALLRLNDEELEPFRNSLWEELPHPLANSATNLIELVVSRSTEGTFFRKTLPKVLQTERRGAGAILRLFEKHPELFTQVDYSLVLKFGARFVEQEVPLTTRWSRGVRLLITLLDRLPEAPLETRYNIHLPLLRALFQGCTEGFLWVAGDLPYPEKLTPTDATQLLRYIFRVLREVEEDVEALDMILPSRPSLDRLVTALVAAFAPENCIKSGNTLNLTALVALKSLAILLQSHTVSSNVDLTGVARRADLLVDIVLQPSRRRSPISREPFASDFARVNLRPETSAFDILCCLPDPTFADALAFALSQCDPQKTLLTSPPYKNYRVIESLLWLSNTRRHFWETSLALIQGGACEYLARVLCCDDPQSRLHRTFWRAKGLAMTCFGNIMERMDREELRYHVGRDVIESAVRIREDSDTPTVQKGQAIFMLQRYTTVANQCGIEPLYEKDAPSNFKTSRFPDLNIDA